MTFRMFRTRRALARVGAGGLVAVIGVSGCSSATPGAAAVVGTTRIEQSTVGEQVRSVNELSGRPADEPSAELARTIVSYDVSYEIVDQTARKLDANVSQDKLNEAFDQQVAQLGGLDQLQVAAAQQGIPPVSLRRYVESQMLVAAIVEKVAPGIAQEQQQAKLIEVIGDVADDVGVEIAPKYGQWDPQTLQIGPITDPVSKPQSTPESALPPQ